MIFKIQVLYWLDLDKSLSFYLDNKAGEWAHFCFCLSANLFPSLGLGPTKSGLISTGGKSVGRDPGKRLQHT